MGTGKNASTDPVIRHLLDLCRKSDRTGIPQYSGFLSTAEQDDFLHCTETAGMPFFFTGGYETAERRILAAGHTEQDENADIPISVISVTPISEKYAEELTHRDYLGSILGLGIARSLIGDILIRGKQCWFFCLSSAAELIASSLNTVRRTAVCAEVTSADIPELQPRYDPLQLNVVSERLDVVTAAFTGMSRAQAGQLFAAERVFVNGRNIQDKSMRLKEGDILSIRGFGKAVYDGIEHETKKNRLWVSLRKYI